MSVKSQGTVVYFLTPVDDPSCWQRNLGRKGARKEEKGEREDMKKGGERGGRGGWTEEQEEGGQKRTV